MQHQAKDIVLSEGLEGQDVNIDALTRLWEELQLASVEAAHPELDLISFASAPTTFYFAVITQKDEKNSESSPRESLDDRESYQAPSVPRVEVSTNTKRTRPLPKKPCYDNLLAQLDPRFDTTNATSTTLPDSSIFWQWPEQRDSQVSYPSGSGSNGLWTPYIAVVDAKPPIGIIYLTTSSNSNVIEEAGELNIGIILDPKHRGCGYAHQAVELVLAYAFDKVKCHRVQAMLMDNHRKDSALALFTQLRFGHEGTRRRSFFSPLEQEWKDVTYLAILDTDYMLRSYFKAAPKSLWDELFIRHDRERQALLRWEENKARLNRTASMETIRVSPEAEAADLVVAQLAVEKGKGKREFTSDYDVRDAYDASASEEDSDFEEVTHKFRKVHDGVGAIGKSPSPNPGPSPSPSPSPGPDFSDPFDDVADSPSGSVSPIDSQWDMMDIYSTDSSSNFEML